MLESTAYNKNCQQQTQKQQKFHFQRQSNSEKSPQALNNILKLPEMSQPVNLKPHNRQQGNSNLIVSKQRYFMNSEEKEQASTERQKQQVIMGESKYQYKAIVLPKISLYGQRVNNEYNSKEEFYDGLKASKVSKNWLRKSKHQIGLQQNQLFTQQNKKKRFSRNEQFPPKKIENPRTDSSQNQNLRDTFAIQVQQRLQVIMQGGKLQDPLQIKLEQQDDFESKVNKNRQLIKRYKQQRQIFLKGKQSIQKGVREATLSIKQNVSESENKRSKVNTNLNQRSIVEIKSSKGSVLKNKKSMQIILPTSSKNTPTLKSQRKSQKYENYQMRNDISKARDRNNSGKKSIDNKSKVDTVFKNAKGYTSNKIVSNTKKSPKNAQASNQNQKQKNVQKIFKQPSQPIISGNSFLFDSIQNFLQNPHLKRASSDMRSSSLLSNQQTINTIFRSKKGNNSTGKHVSKDKQQQIMRKIDVVQNKISLVSQYKQKNPDYYNEDPSKMQNNKINQRFSKLIQPPSQTVYGDWRKIEILPHDSKENTQKSTNQTAEIKITQSLLKAQNSPFLKIVTSSFDKQLQKVSKYHRKSQQNLFKFVQNQKILLQLEFYKINSNKRIKANSVPFN